MPQGKRLQMIPLALILVLCTFAPAPATGYVQEAEQIEGNPFEGDPDAIEQGMSRYRARCALCHGMDAKGYRAPDLTSGQSRHGDSDVQLFRVIRRGVPGTEMRPTRMPDDELWTVIAYLRTLGGSAEADPGRGNAQNGENLYWGSANCSRCHMLNGKGGRLGPDLSRIGTARSRDAFIREIRSASEYIRRGFESVTVVTGDGTRIRGIRKNRDAFSIQMMDTGERLRTFMTGDLREVIDEEQSIMPSYGPDRLSDADVDDLIRYLRSVAESAASERREP